MLQSYCWKVFVRLKLREILCTHTVHMQVIKLKYIISFHQMKNYTENKFIQNKSKNIFPNCCHLYQHISIVDWNQLNRHLSLAYELSDVAFCATHLSFKKHTLQSKGRRLDSLLFIFFY